MSSKATFSIIFLISLCITQVKSTEFNVVKFGAKANGVSDIRQILLNAWKEACSKEGSSKIIIPKGTYALGGPTTLAGPCKGSMHLVIQGTLRAPSSIKGDTWLSFYQVNELRVSGGGTLDGQGQKAWTKNTCKVNAFCASQAYNLRLDYVNNALVQHITSLNSKNFHINILGSNGVTLDKVTISAPENSPNTDGIHIGRSTNVTIMNTDIATGDDCISIGDGSQQVNVTNVTCGPGHGFAVGSLGKYPNEQPVSGIYFTDCTLTKTANGLRIKSWPGLKTGMATDLVFQNIMMDQVSFPVIIDQQYCPHNQCNTKSSSKVKISNVAFKNITGTSTTEVAVQLMCSSGIPCEKVELEDVDIKTTGGSPAKSMCSNVKPRIAGTFTAAGSCKV